MNHWLTAPVLVPAITAILMLLTARADRKMHRAAGVLSTLGTLAVSIALVLGVSDGVREVYSFGAWPVPLGILFVADRLSTLMVLLTSIVGVGALLYAVQGWDERGKNFHALFQFQLMGINGAFLTGDIFNLFVFFEILLIASYGLLLHGGGEGRIRAGLHYVIFNLTGSALFLFGLGFIYGTLGTLNMADLAVRVSEVPPEQLVLVKSAGLLLFAVFSIKAAVLPLYYWLPNTYGSASPPVAALFAIMTKVGIYSILRLSGLIYGLDEGPLGQMLLPWIVPAGLLTMFTASLGALASTSLRALVSWLVIASVGTLLIAIGVPTREALAGGLYYMIHSTVVMAGLYLLVDLIARQRGTVADRLESAPAVAQPALLGSLFFLAAVAVAGMPPLSGFFGKVLVLRGVVEHEYVAWIFLVVLGGGLLGLVGLGRAGSNVFWKTASSDGSPEAPHATFGELLPVLLFLSLTALLVVFGGTVVGWMEGVADQILDPRGYIESVFAYNANGEG